MSNKIDKKTVKYVIYARKSTEASDKQVQSIDDQIRIMKARAKRDGLKVAAVLSEAKSGGHPGTRPKFNEMIEIINNGEANGILTWKLDRISRNPQDSGYVHQMMNDGKLAWILTDGRDYCEDDDVIFDVESSMDARYRKDLMKNVRRGMLSKAEKGWTPCVPPVGYLNDYHTKTIVKDPATWDLVRKVFDKWLTGTVTVAELVRYADEIGLRTHQRNVRGGKPVSLTGMRGLLENPFYVGRFRYAKREYNGNHPALITEEEFERSKALLGGLHNTRPKDPEMSFVTQGMLKCAACGYAVVVEKHTKRYKNGNTQDFVYCHCSGKCKKFKCPQKKIFVPEKEILSQIRNELHKYTIDQRFFDLAIEALVEEEDRRVSERDTKVSELNKQKSGVENELSGLRRMRYRGEITDQAWFLSEEKLLTDQIDALDKQINTVESATKNWRKIADDVFMFARYAKEDFDSGIPEKMQYVMKALGAEMKLSGRTVVFTPVKYLIPIKNAVSAIPANSDSGRTRSEQGSDTANGSTSSEWWGIQGLNL